MRFLVPVFLLMAAASRAQPVVSEEVVWRATSGAATYRPGPQAARVAPDRVGFVVAWSEVEDGLSRAHAGRLDASGRLLSVGIRTAGTADAPAVVPFGNRYLAAWLEPGNDGRPLLITGTLDREFKLLSARPVALTSGPPIARASAMRAYVGSGNFLYEVDTDGAPIIAYDLPRPLNDLAVVGDQVGYVFSSLTHTPALCGFFRCSEPYDTYDLTFTWLYRLTSRTSFRFKSEAPAAVGSNGSAFLVVWAEPPPTLGIKASLFGSSFRPFVVSVRGSASFDRLTQPQVAWDGLRWLAVWTSADSIEGAVIGSDLSVTPLTVSARGARPAIAAARRGGFLVTYEIVDFQERRLAARLISFPPGQRERG